KFGLQLLLALPSGLDFRLNCLQAGPQCFDFAELVGAGGLGALMPLELFGSELRGALELGYLLQRGVPLRFYLAGRASQGCLWQAPVEGLPSVRDDLCKRRQPSA